MIRSSHRPSVLYWRLSYFKIFQIVLTCPNWSRISTNIMIFFSVVPSGTLTLGSSLNASNIKEGDDVYFECSVRASPAPYKITWRHNGRELSHNVAKKVIISNQSLVLQKVTRADTGVYTCTAHNSEGDGVSNSINLNIKCKSMTSSFFMSCDRTTNIMLK